MVRNLGKHKCLYFDIDKKQEVPVTQENLAIMKQFVNERNPKMVVMLTYSGDTQMRPCSYDLFRSKLF